MDRQRIADIGNVCSDGIVCQAGIRPDRKSDRLGNAEIQTLRECLHSLPGTAIRCDADPARMPADWPAPHRDGDDSCPRCGKSLASRPVSGRAARHCPGCQS